MEVVIDTVTVGNAGNGRDYRYWLGGRGSVDYVYEISRFEITAAQYTEFLNAVAATQRYGVYDPNMWVSEYGCKIERTGSSGSYTYAVAADWADAARFANWMHNGQPTGAIPLVA